MFIDLCGIDLSGILNDGGENFNQICFENNRVLQREPDILRQELKHQGEEIERLKQETYPNSGQTRNSMKAERSSVKTDHTNDEVFQTDSTSLSHNVNSHPEKIFRQERILMPLNSCSPASSRAKRPIARSRANRTLGSRRWLPRCVVTSYFLPFAIFLCFTCTFNAGK